MLARGVSAKSRFTVIVLSVGEMSLLLIHSHQFSAMNLFYHSKVSCSNFENH